MAVVEDDPSTCDVLVRAVTEELDLRVVGLGSGEQLLALVKTEPVDLVLLDAMLPGLGGIEVLRLLKTDTATAGVPVVVLTVHGPRVQEAARTAGADALLTKPFDLDGLLSLVRRFVPAGPAA